MGMYNNQYESYYAQIMQKGKKCEGDKYKSKSYGNTSIGVNVFSAKWMVNEFIVQAIVTLILIIFIVFCKFNNTDRTKYIYNYGKNILKQNNDITPIINDIKNLNLSDMNNKMDDYLDKAKANILNIKPLKERTKEAFQWPTKGKEYMAYEKSDDKALLIKEKANEKVFSIGEGIVKENNINKVTKESYVVIDNGGGVESVYIGIVTDKLERGMKVTKGQEIGKTLGNFKFQLLYMGKEKNPLEYISI